MPSLPPPLAALRYSHYATQALVAHPADGEWLGTACAAPFDWSAADAALAAVQADGDARGLARALRGLRRRVYLHAMLRDLDGTAALDEVCGNMTRLAGVGIDAAVALHHRALAATHGEPRDETGAAQQLVVIGMGKLGGGELNVSSDIDLVFVYPADGGTDGPRALANREFFDRLGRRVIGALNDVTEDGFVFRVDMRLRPYGESGPLTVPFAALEEYLITQGRTWERYAWLKARPLTGGHHDEVAGLITPFVFRKYLDFDAYEGLRDVHRQIRAQGRRRDYAADVKLGPGGIREVEFIAQALQLVRGGREPALRVRGTQQALAAIGARGLLPGTAASSMRWRMPQVSIRHRPSRPSSTGNATASPLSSPRSSAIAKAKRRAAARVTGLPVRAAMRWRRSGAATWRPTVRTRCWPRSASPIRRASPATSPV